MSGKPVLEGDGSGSALMASLAAHVELSKELQEAHAALEAGQHIGKFVLYVADI